MAALVIFAFAAATDYLDGWVARQRGEVSRFGKLMDPITDKTLTLSAFISFWFLDLVPLWMVAIVLLRDVTVTLQRFRMDPKKEEQAARSSGKQKTFFQLVFIISVLIYLAARQASWWRFGWEAYALRGIEVGMGLITLLTVWSGFRVILKSVKPGTPPTT